MPYQDTPEYQQLRQWVLSRPQNERALLSTAVLDQKFKNKELQSKLSDMLRGAEEDRANKALALRGAQQEQSGQALGLQRQRMMSNFEQAQKGLDIEQRGLRHSMPYNIAALGVQGLGAIQKYQTDARQAKLLQGLAGLYPGNY